MNVPLGGSWGEDPNLNGVRDKDAMTSDWSETDFLAPDSDVDGLSDGAEEWGRWCYKTESSSACNGVTNRSVRQLWTVSPAKNGALTADFDGDGLRDGQETSGGTVGIWYERTMEKVRNYTVASSPLLADTDSDTLTDFSEFMNGSDPGVSDTDGDGITDPQEIERKSNITGIEGTPPQISNVKLEVGIDWDWWGILWLPLRSHVTVSFDVSDNVGLDTVTVKFIRYTGTETRQLQFSNNPGSYTTSAHVNMRFDFSIFEALVAGADVNITAFDVNGNGAWGDFHIKSVLEAVVDAIAAFLSAIAHVIAAAISAACSWIINLLMAVVQALFKPLSDAFAGWARELASVTTRIFVGAGTKGPSRTDEPPMYANDLAQEFVNLQFWFTIAMAVGILATFIWASTWLPTPWAVVIATLSVTMIPLAVFVIAMQNAGYVNPPPTDGELKEADTDVATDFDWINLGITVVLIVGAFLTMGTVGSWRWLLNGDGQGVFLAIISGIFFFADMLIVHPNLLPNGDSEPDPANQLNHNFLLSVGCALSITGWAVALLPDPRDLEITPGFAALVSRNWEEVTTSLDALVAVYTIMRYRLQLEVF